MPKANPTIKPTVLTLDGKEYKLTIDFAALANAESILKKQGHQINLLRSLNFTDMDASGVAAVFYAALLRDQPKMDYLETLNLITFDSLIDIYTALLSAYVAAQPDGKETESPNE